jgi:hypothetical protein
MATTDRLYFVTRTDLSEGRRAAQLLHAMDVWNARFGSQGGTVIVYGVSSEDELLELLPNGDSRTVLWREPDLDNEATAFATDAGRMNLPLLGRAA